MVGIIEIDFTRTSAPVVSSKITKTQKKKRVSSPKYSIPPIAEKIGALVCLGILFMSYGYTLHAPVRPDPLFTVGLPKPDADGIRVQILSSVQSTTGLIVVGEAMTPPRQDLEAYEQEGVLHSLRYLRAAHSLLGGVWFGPRAMTLSENDTPVRDSRGVVLGDSIYGVFVLEEAARLVNSTQKAPENVLIMYVYVYILRVVSLLIISIVVAWVPESQRLPSTDTTWISVSLRLIPLFTTLLSNFSVYLILDQTMSTWRMHEDGRRENVTRYKNPETKTRLYTTLSFMIASLVEVFLKSCLPSSFWRI